MVSRLLSRTSACVLFFAGIVFLFLPDTLLPRLIPAFPAGGAWLGQLLAATWLGLGALNWFSRGAVLGGIYGRPIVTANAVAFFVSATSLVRAAVRQPEAVALWVSAVVAGLFAGAYGWLLFKGPLERDFALHEGSGHISR